MRSSFALALLLVGGCSNEWRTDMWYQPSLRSQAATRSEPSGSVPLTAASSSPVDRDDAEELKDPVAFTATSVAHGKTLFAGRCACCHGTNGRGGGPVSKLFPPAPDLAYEVVKRRTDGYIFGTIVFGGRAMPPEAEGLTQVDRWDLVNFVRHLQALKPGGTP